MRTTVARCKGPLATAASGHCPNHVLEGVAPPGEAPPKQGIPPARPCRGRLGLTLRDCPGPLRPRTHRHAHAPAHTTEARDTRHTRSHAGCGLTLRDRPGLLHPRTHRGAHASALHDRDAHAHTRATRPQAGQPGRLGLPSRTRGDPVRARAARAAAHNETGRTQKPEDPKTPCLHAEQGAPHGARSQRSEQEHDSQAEPKSACSGDDRSEQRRNGRGREPAHAHVLPHPGPRQHDRRAKEVTCSRHQWRTDEE